MLASATRALRVLKAFGGSRAELGVTELAREIGLSKSSAHLLLATLQGEGFVERNTASGRYQLGPAAVRLGVVALDRIGLGPWTRPVLQELAARTGETATIGVLDGDAVLFVERVESREPLRVDLRVGTRVALHGSAIGKVLLAGLPEEHRERLLASLPLPALAGRTITDHNALRAELVAVAERGLATSIEEILPGISAVAAPIRDWAGNVVAGVSVAWPTGRQGVERHAPHVREAAARLSARLGYEQHPSQTP